MSLINKMLQELDARGTPGTDAFPSQIRPVAPERRTLAARFNPKAVAAIVIGTLAGLALAWFVRGQYLQSHAAPTPPAAARPLRPAPAARAEQGMSGTITMGPANAAAPAPPAPVQAVETPVPVTRPAAHEPKQGTALPDAAAAPPKSVAPFEPDSEDARAARQAIMAELQGRMPAGGMRQAAAHEAHKETGKEARRARKAAQAAALAAATRASSVDADMAATRAKRGPQGRQEAASQRAESEYRRALASLQDGRMTEAVAALEQTLKLDPGHDAARQTLVGLLIEAKRSDEAIRHLQAGLALDARQPALAMLLARLQIERGGSGIETLMATLPYAGKDTGRSADYHAFLAGALERGQRHREAAEQYQAALRIAPGNGVWWMGLGMALQADRRNAEAQEAFQRARASGTLGPELQAFVERRLQQLAR
jgi:MSHA biogenesis protein MshN